VFDNGWINHKPAFYGIIFNLFVKKKTMPELPDLQVFSSNLDKKLKGKTLKKITIQKKKIVMLHLLISEKCWDNKS
jgi:hypothetical protein